MPNEIPVVHQGITVLRCAASLKFGIAPVGQRETTPLPVTSPSKHSTGRSSAHRTPRARSTPQLVSPVPRLSEQKHVPNERRRSAFAPDTSITARPSFDGVGTGSVVRSSISKVNGFDTVLMQVGKWRRFYSFNAVSLLNKVLRLPSHPCWS